MCSVIGPACSTHHRGVHRRRRAGGHAPRAAGRPPHGGGLPGTLAWRPGGGGRGHPARVRRRTGLPPPCWPCRSPGSGTGIDSRGRSGAHGPDPVRCTAGPRLTGFTVPRDSAAADPVSSGYRPPEQEPGKSDGPAGNVFRLGAVLVFAATGEGPFGRGAPSALRQRRVLAEPDLSGAPGNNRPLIAQCLDRDPAARPTPGALRAALGALGVDPDEIARGWLRPGGGGRGEPRAGSGPRQSGRAGPRTAERPGKPSHPFVRSPGPAGLQPARRDGPGQERAGRGGHRALTRTARNARGWPARPWPGRVRAHCHLGSDGSGAARNVVRDYPVQRFRADRRAHGPTGNSTYGPIGPAGRP